MNERQQHVHLTILAVVGFATLLGPADSSGQEPDNPPTGWEFLETDSDCDQDPNLALSIHTGTTNSHGALAQLADQGTTINFDVVFPLTSRLGWDIRLGYSDFSGLGGQSDVSINNLSANLSYIVIDRTPWVFVNAGPGIYQIDNSDTEYGANLGIGVGYPWGPNRVLEFTYNYHWALSASPQYRFDKIQIGIVQKF